MLQILFNSAENGHKLWRLEVKTGLADSVDKMANGSADNFAALSFVKLLFLDLFHKC
jgi:hypothetical protein